MSSDLYIPSASVGGWGANFAANTAGSAATAAVKTAGNVAASAGDMLGDTLSSAAGAVTSPFASVLQSVMNETGALQSTATKAVTGMLSGSGVEVQDAMLATQKADMAFELAMQVRNKAVAAYQQMMGMQF